MAVFALLEIIKEDEGRNRKEVEEVDTDRKSHEE